MKKVHCRKGIEVKMNEVETIFLAMRIEADGDRESYLAREFAKGTAKITRLRSILLRAQSLITDHAELGDTELRLRIHEVIGEMEAEEANQAPDGIVDAHGEIPNTFDSNALPPDSINPLDQTKFRSKPDADPMPTKTFTATDQTTSLIAERYTLLKKIGEGGMGEVWRAKQSEPVKRHVALELIKKGMDSKALLSRFEQERQALAVMDHPNIARVFDGGMTEQGQPFFAMELVSGQPLTDYADKEKLNTEERLQLFVLICNAVQHAHQKGIVHRDLKPANILVTTVDGKPVPKVIDFGVAKATGGRLTDESMSTQFGAIVGTLEYMAPEQAVYGGFDIDTRADIYSLGVVLYELLTGLRPIDRARLQNAGLSEMIRVIKEDEPSKPSTRLSSSDSLPAMAAVRRIEPRRLTALLRGELDWVVMKCLEKQRERRYESANGLARDIQRYLANEIVEARPPSRSYRLKKFVSKHRGQVLSASIVLLALLIGTVAATLGLLEAQLQTELANQATNEKDLALQKESQQAEKERIARLIAEAMTRNALDANNAMVFDIQEELAPKPGLQALRMKLLRKAREGLTKILEQSRKQGSPDATIVSTHYQLGDLEWNLGDAVAAKKEFQKGLQLAQQLAASRPQESETQRLLSNGYTKLGDAIKLLGDTEGAGAVFLRSLEIDRALVAKAPKNTEEQQNLCIDLDKLGDVALRQGDPEKALKYYRECFEIRSALVASDNTDIRLQRDLSSVHTRLGDAKVDLGNVAEALTHYKSALIISKKLAELHPENVEVQSDFGLNSGRVGNVLKGIAKPGEAMDYFLDALNALKPLVDTDPQNAEIKRELGGIYQRLGDTSLGLNDAATALEHYEKGLAISQVLANLSIGSTEAQRDLSINNEKLGDVLMAFERPSDAHAYYKTALEISERLAVADPNNAQAQSDVGYGYLKLGEVMSMQARFDEATKYQRQALDLRLALAANNPTNAGAKTEAYRSHCLVGEAMLSDGKYDDALVQFKSAQGVLAEMLDKGWYADPDAKIASDTVEENRQQLNDYIWLCENAAKAVVDVEFVMAQEPKLVPRIMRLRIQSLMKSVKSEDAFRSADLFADWIEEQKVDPGESHYQAGCLYALCVSQDKSNLEKCVMAAVKRLEKAHEAGYFDEAKLFQLKQNPALTAVRSHPKFSSFVMSLTSAN
jgi:serine/threonine protein kinase/Flp pilus assembly protein TadD